MPHVFKVDAFPYEVAPGIDPKALSRVLAKPLTQAEERAQLQLAIDQLADGIKKAKTVTKRPPASVTISPPTVTISPGRKPTYRNAAERQKAYRERKGR